MFVWDNVIAAVGGVVKPLVAGWSERRTIKAKAKVEKEVAKGKLAVAKIDAETKLVAARAEADALDATRDFDYDREVLHNRQTSSADEWILFIIGLSFVMHFVVVPGYFDGAEIMHNGWAAMGYSGIPYWYEFALLGALISTLGLFRLFRLFKFGGGK